MASARLRFSLQLFAVATSVIAGVGPVAAAPTCDEQVVAALKTVKGGRAGVQLSCCTPEQVDCHLIDSGYVCDDVNAIQAWCLSAGTSSACTISYTYVPTSGYGAEADTPCGAYAGPVGSTFGMSPVASKYPVPFDSSAIVGALQKSWPQISSLSDKALCCSAVDAVGAAPCHVGNVTALEENHCDQGEYELKCYGEGSHGLCTVFDNVTTSNTTEIGQYYLVNFDDDAPQPAPSSSTSPKLAVILPATVIPIFIVILGASTWLVLRRRRRASRTPVGALNHVTTPYPLCAEEMTRDDPAATPQPASSTLPLSQSTSPPGQIDSNPETVARQEKVDNAIMVSSTLPPYSLHSDVVLTNSLFPPPHTS